MRYPAPWRGINPKKHDLLDQLIQTRKRACHRKYILVIDEDPRACVSLQELLRLSGYESIAAQGSREAIAQLKQHRFELILLDLDLVDFSSQQVIEYINEHNLDSDLIMITGDTGFDLRTLALPQSTHHLLRKPYKPTELLRWVASVLDKRMLKDENQCIQLRMEESENLHRFIVNNSPDIIYLLNREGKFTYINERIESLLGFKQDEIMGEHYSMLIFQDDIKQANYTFNERRTGERATKRTEIRLRCKDFDAPHHYASNIVPVELSSIGVYSINENKQKEYIGTYGVVRDISERKQTEELIKYQLYHDLLTSLPNRTLFRDRLNVSLAQAKRNKKRLAVLYLDMDRFKFVNDTHGHLVGDELLQMVAHRLKSGLREGDTLARVGGDEFNLLIPEINSVEDSRVLAKKILKLFNAPFQIGGKKVFVSFSIGISIYPDHGDSRDVLIKNADIAMYHVKSSGKNGYVLYRDSMKNLYSPTLDIEKDLIRAIENDELRVFYQPQVDIVNNRIVGVEALVRWQHPIKGLLTPVEFINIAEDTGLVVELGDWMLNKVAKDVSRWLQESNLKLSISLNISIQQLEVSDFVPRVLQIIRQYKLPRYILELEITESQIMQDMERVIESLSALSQKGIRIAIDNFGTGYSSLGYLKTLPINTLKMDRSFVHSIGSRGDNSIVDTIIAMANGLNLDLIAEGVENQIQQQYLIKSGCKLAQGHHYSYPLPESKILAVIKRGNARS